MNLILNEKGDFIKSMYNSCTEWNSETSNTADRDNYDDIYNSGLGLIFTTNQFHELTLPARSIEDEDIWILPEIEENTIHSTQRSFGGLMSTQVGNDPEYTSVPNCWNFSSNKEYASTLPTSFNTKCVPINNLSSLNLDESLSNHSICAGSISDNSSVSHTSTLNGVWVVPNTNKSVQMQISGNKVQSSSSDEASIETTYSERRRRIHFSRQRPDLAIDRTRIKISNSSKYKNTELSMLVASGGAPLGKLDEIGGVEWYPERQSWKVVGHTGISWCVRRKTWRVWFITSTGTRATRSFNPKEHGTVAAALKAAIEFLEQKRAEKSPTQKNLRSRLKRNNLCNDYFSSDRYLRSNNPLSNNHKYRNVDDLIN